MGPVFDRGGALEGRSVWACEAAPPRRIGTITDADESGMNLEYSISTNLKERGRNPVGPQPELLIRLVNREPACVDS